MAFKTTAASYKTRVTVQQPTETVNDAHEVELTWGEYAKRWARLAPTSGIEFQAAMQQIPMLQVLMRMRSDNATRAITPRMRIVVGTRVLNIAAVFDESNERREIVVMCVEVV